VLTAAAATAALDGCSGDDNQGSGDDAGSDATSDVTTSPDTGGGTDSAPADAGRDTGPPFDCTADTPDGGADAGPQLPNHLRCTGLYSDWDSKTVAAEMKQFTPAYVLWSDGAIKTRWAFIPAGKKIDTTDPDEWVFPVDSKFFKEFQIGGKRVETRLFWKVAAGTWLKTTYVWSADGSSATRQDNGSGGPGDAGLIDDGGTAGGLDGATTYEIPSVKQCDGCHNGRLDKILGFEAISLGAPAVGSGGVTLTSLKQQGLLSANDGGATALPDTLTIPEDTSNKARATIGWLHANCGTTCHNNNPSAGCYFNTMRLRVGVGELTGTGTVPTVDSLQAYKTTVNQAATTALGDPNQKPYDRITKGNTAKSLIRYLVSRRVTNETFGQMPPLDSHIVDVADVAILDGWITTMP
jgi:hypothetical protein